MADRPAPGWLLAACRKAAMRTGRTFAEPLTEQAAYAFLASTRPQSPVTRRRSRRRRRRRIDPLARG